ncbi:trypsin-like peptidase domain-containing protein [Pseudomonadota bacterium]
MKFARLPSPEVRTIIGLLAMVCSPAMAQTAVDGEWVWTPDKSVLSSAPPMWEQIRQAPREPMVSLEAIEITGIDKLEALSEWNRKNSRPIQNGITHHIYDRAHVTIGPDASNLMSSNRVTKLAKSDRYGQTIQTADGDLVWSATILVDESHQLRVRLDDIDLPEKAQLWVQGAKGGRVGPFGKELIDDEGGLWTPSVSGPELTIVLLVPGEEPTAEFTVTQVAELFLLDKSGQPLINQTQEEDTSCLMDTACVPDSTWEWLDENSTAVAHLHFINNGGSYVCSGGLIIDNDEETYTPHFLTANHCISTQNAASSLEAYWDYKTSYCGGSKPSHYSLERTNGAKLLVTGTEGDFTLLELNSIPSGRWFMGYDARSSAITPGTTLHRISNPGDGPQSYSQMKVDGGTGICTSLPRTSYIYQSLVMGATLGGSSGSPVMNSSGQIVGQLYGSCGDNPGESCDYSTLDVDGAMQTYWSKVAPYLAPQDVAPADLSITDLDAVSGSYSESDQLDVRARIVNIGGSDSSAYKITFYASKNSTISTTDYPLYYWNMESLAPGENHHYTFNNYVVSGIPDGQYYIGAIISVSDANASNNTRLDSERISIQSQSNFQITPGLNGSWFNPSASGQGFFIDVLPANGIVFMSWFTFDTVLPPSSYAATFGDPGHRWVTAQGPYSGNRANLGITLTQGGVMNSSSPSPKNVSYGSIVLEFTGCNTGKITYSIPGIATNQVIPIERVVTDNVALCESMTESAKGQSSSNLQAEPVPYSGSD